MPRANTRSKASERSVHASLYRARLCCGGSVLLALVARCAPATSSIRYRSWLPGVRSRRFARIELSEVRIAHCLFWFVERLLVRCAWMVGCRREAHRIESGVNYVWLATGEQTAHTYA